MAMKHNVSAMQIEATKATVANAAFYSKLAGDEGKDAYAYLKNRGIKNSTIKMFGIGYAPNSWNALVDAMRKKGYTDEELQEADLVGEKNFERFGVEFPLLIKMLDAQDTLSIQVHPNDELAAERHDSYGKSEMWYITNHEEGAAIYVGFKRPVSREEFIDAVITNRLPELLNRYEVKKGDVYFIPAGTIHTIGKGIELIEIQQT